MTNRSAMPETARPGEDDLSDADVAALMSVLDQVRQARADQREALLWLAQHDVQP